MAIVPPWLNIDPVAPVGRLLEGFRTGLSAGEAQRSANQRAEQMAFAQAQAAENARIRQEQNQLEARQFEMQFRLKEKEAERQAQEAAMQLEGMQTLEKRLAAGEPFEQVWAQVAPKVLYRHPERIPDAMRSMVPQPGWTPSGVEYMTDPRGGVHFPSVAAMRQGFTPQVQTFGEGQDAVRAIEVRPGSWQTVRQGQQGTLTQTARAKLQELNRDEARLYKNIAGLSEEEALEADPEAVEKIAEIEAERHSIYNGTWSPTGTTSPTAILPLPAKEEEAVTGQVYQTSRGPARWNGTKFVQ